MNEPPSPRDLSRLKIDDGIKSVDTARARGPRIKPIAATLTLFILGAIYLGRSSPTEEPNVAKEKENSSISYQAVSPASGVLNASGYVVAQRQAAVASKATGRLRELRVVEGDLVKSGDILGIIENEDVLAGLKEAEATVALAEAKIVSAQAELTDAKLDLTRLISLRKSSLISQAELDGAQARFDKATAEIDSQKANLDVGKARLERANVELEYTFIRAPFDGTVLTKDADVGEIVAPFGSSTNSRAAIVTIADMSSLEIEADVSEANLTKVSVGQKVEITLDSIPDRRYAGIVSKIVPTVDRAKGTVLTKIKFVEIDKSVIPEMSAKVTFLPTESAT